MSSPQSDVTRSLRKGTKSCAECRRRKVRCVRLSDDAKSCRQCEDRGSVCIQQISSRRRSSQTLRLPSRHRITQLESHVAQLTKLVHRIEVRLGDDPYYTLSPKGIQNPAPSGSDDGESSVSDFPMADHPSHLRSLFHNDWLSADTLSGGTQTGEHQGRAFTHLSRIMRPRLQSLIPSKEEVTDITRSSFDWLTMLHSVLPQPCVAACQQELLDTYDEMCKPDVDVIKLASWLLTLALSAPHSQQESDTHEDYFLKFQERIRLSRNITDTVESTLLCNDRMLATVEALGMAVHYARLLIGQGNIQKSWITIRRLIAIAELMGLPRICQCVRLGKLNSTDDQQALHKAQLWELLCNMERISGLILNLPPDTRRYPRVQSLPVVVDGTVQAHVYMSKLMEISTRIHELDEPIGIHGPGTESHMAAFEIAQDLGALASQTPRSWWVFEESTPFRPEHFVQFMHYSVLMRAYLSLALRQDSRGIYVYSRLPCMDACDTVARRYLILRQRLPLGSFVSRMLDLQAFTATAVLLLLSRNIPPGDRYSFRVDTDRLQRVIAEVIELMGKRSKDPGNSDLAEQGYHALCALSELLRPEDNASSAKGLTLKVPLLGMLHIRRNIRPVRSPKMNDSSIPPPLAHNIPGNSQIQTAIPLPQTPMKHQSIMPTNVAVSIPEEWQWDDFSWSIEERPENFLGNALVAESLDQPALWYGGDPNIQLPFWNAC